MRRITYSDYVEWECDWCDSENKTELAVVIKGEAVCGACHSRLSSDEQILQATGLEGYAVGVAA